MSKLTTYVLIAILVILTVGIGYFIFQNQKLIKNLNKEQRLDTSYQSPSPIKSPEEQPKNSPSQPSSKQLTLEETREAITTYTNLKKHEGLIPFMVKPNISVVLYASECCQPMTPVDATKQLDYINEGIPFDFNQTTDRVKNLKAKNPQLENTYIGISKDKEYLIAYTLDNNNLISKFEMSVSWKLYSL